MEKKKKRRFTRALILTVLAGAILYSIISSQEGEKRELLAVGDAAPNFTLVDMDGASHTLSDYRGQGVFLNFWGTWCEPCKKEMPAMNRQHAIYASQGVQTLAVNIEQSPFEVQKFMQQYGLQFPVVIDTTGDVKQAYSIIPLPTTVLINPEGTVTKIITGEMTEQQIAQHMESIKPTEPTAQLH